MGLNNSRYYVHYHFYNYKYKDDGNSIVDSHKRTLRAIAANNTKNLNSKQLGELQQQMNFFFGGKVDSFETLDYTPAQQALIKEAIAEVAQNFIASKHPDWDQSIVNLDTLKVTGSSLKNEMHELLNKRYKNLNDVTYTYTDAIEQRLVDIAKLMTNIANQSRVYKISKELERLQKEYNGMREEVMKSRAQENKDCGEWGKRMKFPMAEDSRRSQFIRDLNRLLTQTKEGYANYLQGVIGEAMAAASNMVITRVASQGIDSILSGDLFAALEKRMVGENTSKKILNETSRLFPAGGENCVLDVANFNAHLNATDDKVDVLLELPDVDKKITGSVKNVSLKAAWEKGITLQSGTSYLKMLQDFPTVYQHYANVTANHPYPVSSMTLKQAHDLAKMTLATYGLIGGMYSDKGRTAYSDVFIINDNDIGGYRVFSSIDVVNKILENVDMIWGYQEKVWENEWIGGSNNVGAGIKRSMKVMAQIHEMKYKISIAPGLLDKI